MTPKVQKRAAAVAVHPRADENLLPRAGTSGTVGADVKPETPPSPNPWPTEFGWDFPFDFPKRA
jgi:hypothetical protein